MKTKRIVALLLALMLAVSVITISAYAEGDDDGIEPYGQVIQCPKCGYGGAVLKCDAMTPAILPGPWRFIFT